MKKVTPILVAAVAILGAAALSPANAQVYVVAQVPFEFQIGDTTMPRDVYTISRVAGAGTLMVRSEHRGVFVIAQSSGNDNAGSRSKLVFYRIGNQYFLRELQLSGLPAMTLPESRSEREARRLLASAGTDDIRRVVIPAPPR
jgi:hypothetical protein